MICSDELPWSACTQNGAQPAGSTSGSANGSPPSGRDTVASQSQSATASGLHVGPISAKTSNACSAAAGWLPADRRSGSRPQP